MTRTKRENPPPTRIYTFGLPVGPTQNGDIIDEQIKLARRYQNNLVAIERARRGAYRAILSEVGDIADIEARIEKEEATLRAMRETVKRMNAKDRRRSATAATRQAIGVVNKRLKDLRLEHKEMKRVIREDPDVAQRIKNCDDRAADMERRYRAVCDVYWGTYLLVEQAMRAAKKEKTDPNFHSYNGSGRVGIQLQNGLPVKELYGDDTRIQIDLTPKLRVSRRHPEGRPVKHSATVKLRIGSRGPGGREPIWAVFPVVLHRPIPEDAVVKWAWAQRKPVGTKWRWEFQLVLESRTFVQLPKTGSRACGIDLGWRKRDDGLRAAFMFGTDKRCEEIAMPQSVMDSLLHADSLRSIRDTNFNSIRETLSVWLGANSAPDWLTSSLLYLAKWRSTKKLTRVVFKWRGNRFAGDDVIFVAMEDWRKQERHLYQWESNERNRALLRRKDWYRVTARKIAEQYDTIVIENFNISKVAELPKPEEKEKQHARARHQRFMAAPSEFRAALFLAASNTGAQIVKIPAAYTTVTCHNCVSNCVFDAARNLRHRCASCGREWDQDENAARNLLRVHLDGSGRIVPAHRAA